MKNLEKPNIGSETEKKTPKQEDSADKAAREAKEAANHEYLVKRREKMNKTKEEKMTPEQEQEEINEIARVTNENIRIDREDREKARKWQEDNKEKDAAERIATAKAVEDYNEKKRKQEEWEEEEEEVEEEEEEIEESPEEESETEKTKEEVPEEIKEEEKIEKETQELEVEEEPQPWDKLKTEEEANLIDDYEKRSEISDETKKTLDEIIHGESDQKRFDFAQEWFKEHKDEIKERGYDIESKEPGYMVKITNECGGFDELKEKEEYGETNEAIDNLYALRTDLQKEKVPLESQFLILNLLDKKTERAEQEFNEAGKKGDVAISIAKQQELGALFKIKKELSEKISGRDLTQEAENKANPLEGKEAYVDKYLESYLNKVVDKGDPNSAMVYAKELGYTVEKKGLIMKRMEVRDGKGNLLASLKEKELDKFLDGEMEKKMTEDLKEEWEIKNGERETEIKRIVEQEIKTLGQSSEKAEQGIESIYDRVKKRLKTEFIEKDLKKNKKTKEQLKNIEKEFKGKGKNPTEFIDDLINRKGSLKELKGDLKQDRKKINSFLKDWGISAKNKDFDEFQEVMEKEGRSYDKQTKKEKGFLEWILDFILFADSESKKSNNKK